MLCESYPLYLGNEPVAANTDLVVTNKYTLQPAARVARADQKALDRAIAMAAEAFAQTRRMPSYQRQAILTHVVRRVEERHEELSQALAVEAGKPLRDARGEGDAAGGTPSASLLRNRCASAANICHWISVRGPMGLKASCGDFRWGRVRSSRPSISR